jgi:guanine deaminase
MSADGPRSGSGASTTDGPRSGSGASTTDGPRSGSGASTTDDLTLRARLLTPRSKGAGLTFLDDALVRVEGGRVVSVEASTSANAAGARDLRPLVLMPGFVDAHVHFPQTRIIGSATGPLLDWLERTVFPEEARFAVEAYAVEVAGEFTRALARAGTTTSAIFSSSSETATDALFAALDRAGLRAFAGLTLMDQRCPDSVRVDAASAMRAAGRLADRWDGHDRGRLRFAVTPRFALSCSRALLDAAGRFARERDLWVQTHIAENEREGEETLSAHPFASDYLDVYESTGLVGPRTMLAHAVHLSASEWDRVAARRARIAHCPDSNFFLGSGRMRVSEASRRGVRVALGSDVGAGRSFSIRRAVLHAYDNALCLGDELAPAALLRMATLGGAEALDLGDVVGSIEPEKEADLVALRLPAHARTEAEVVAAIAFADDTEVEATWVRGRAVFARS